MEGVLQDVRELIEYPLRHPEVYRHLGVEPPRGILLHGPPGCGKTLLANAIAGECGVNFLKISAPEVVSGMSGESEQKVSGEGGRTHTTTTPPRGARGPGRPLRRPLCMPAGARAVSDGY
jgi:AAA+ superfamily predicted ATPase